MQKKVAYLGLGSNIGDKFNYLNQCIEKINRNFKIEVTKRSSFYETIPIGYEKQEKFINLCVEIKTTLSPMKLLNELQKIEFELHRERIIRWGPRTIDIDILLYDNIVIEGTILMIPHSRMLQRQFVLIPLKEINDKLIINGHEINYYLDKLEDQGVKKLTNEK